MNRFTLLILVFSQTIFPQKYKTVLCDSLNKLPIIEANIFKPNGEFITQTDVNGEFFVKNEINKIYITAYGYKALKIDKNLDTIFLSRNIIELKEVIVTNNKKIGFCAYKKKFTDGITSSLKYNFLICATKIEVNNKCTIDSYNFFIKEVNNNSSFNLLIYNEKEGKPNEIIYSQTVYNYKTGWNREEINETVCLETGTYFIAMQWLPEKDKTDIKKVGRTKIYSVGQVLGVAECDSGMNSDFVYNYKWTSTDFFKNKNKSFGHYIEIYEN